MSKNNQRTKYWILREKEKSDKETKVIEDYEGNLQLHYESKRKELDLLLSSSLPHQISNIKMILWINFLFFGLSASILKDMTFYWYYLISYGLSFLAVMSMMIALMKRRSRMYGSIDQLDYVNEEIQDGAYAKSTILSGLLHNAYTAVEYNRTSLHRLSKYIHFSVITTSMSVMFFFIVIMTTHLITTKEGTVKVPEKNERPKPSEVRPPQRPIHEAEERSLKPSIKKPMPKIDKDK